MPKSLFSLILYTLLFDKLDCTGHIGQGYVCSRWNISDSCRYRPIQTVGYTQPEQLLFLSLRVLHWEYRHREITLEQARKEKERLAREYIQAARFQVIYQQAVEIRNHMGQYLTMANKGKCPVCKKLVEIFEGRE